MTSLHRAAFGLLFSCVPLLAQTATPDAGLVSDMGTVSRVGQLGATLSLINGPSAPLTDDIKVVRTGTAPSICSFVIEGSINGFDWVPLSGPLLCTSSNSVHIKPGFARYGRVNVKEFTAGDATTSVRVTYFQGEP